MVRGGGTIKNYTVASRTREGIMYRICVVDSIPWMCTCPAFFYKKSCNHLVDIRSFLAKYSEE